MRLRGWLRRNAPWLVLMVMAPVAGGLVSYFGLTWLASSDGAPEPPANRAEAGAASTPTGGWTVEQARNFSDYAVFWLGDHFEGMPLRSIGQMRHSPPEGVAAPSTDMVSVSYGDCNPKPCVAPVTITSTPYCLVRPEMSAEGLLGPSFELRGATAHWVGRGENTLALFTGASTVTVIAPAGREAVLEIAKELMAVNPLGPSSPSQALGPVSVNSQ